MTGIVDFHSHVLPCIDDGSASVEESLTMLRMEAEQGIRQVVATPHFYPQHDTPERFLQRRKKAEEMLLEAVGGKNDLPDVVFGAEVYYFHGISNCDALPQLTIDKRECILLEMPLVPWTDRMYSELEEIPIRWGITPIIAHVDRYLNAFRDFGIPRRLEKLPVLVQANASFFLHSGTRRKALKMLKQDQIQLLGSDCHNVSSRPPNLGKALQVIERGLSNEVLESVMAYQERIFPGV